MKIGIATDHGGFGLKEELLTKPRGAGHEVIDFGAHKLKSDDDYPDYVTPLAKAVAKDTCGDSTRWPLWRNRNRSKANTMVSKTVRCRQTV